MQPIKLDDITLHVQEDGDAGGAPLVFINSLGTDLRIWDKVVARLPEGLRIIRFDNRGHGLTTAPQGPYSMGTLVKDTEQMLSALEVEGAVLVGLSIGGLIAQGLATKRLDMVRAMVLSNTGAKIGTREIWNDRIAGIEKDGLEGQADAVMERWFSKAFRETDELQIWRNMLTQTPPQGYIGCGHAIAGSDFYSTTAALRLPTLGIAGSEDNATPPDLVRETTDLVPGSKFALMRGVGHIPCVEDPEGYTDILVSFLREIGHI